MRIKICLLNKGILNKNRYSNLGKLPEELSEKEPYFALFAQNSATF